MKQQLTRLSPHQNGKAVGTVLGVVSLPIVVIVHLLMALTPPTPAQNGYVLEFPLFMYLLFPPIYFLIGYVTVAFACLVYNFLSPYIGGFEFEWHAKSDLEPAQPGNRQRRVELAKRLLVPTLLLGITAFLIDQTSAVSGQPEAATPEPVVWELSLLPQQDCGSINGIALPCWKDYLSVDGFEGNESLPYFPYAKRPNGCSFPKAIPGTKDSINVSGLMISFTDICNVHDRCYYTLGTTPWECNAPFQDSLRARCVYEFMNQPLNTLDVLTLGVSREEAQILCNTEAMFVAGAVIGAQDYSHRLAQERQREYLARVDQFIRKSMVPR